MERETKLAAARRRRGLSQRGLADLMGYDFTAISKIERGVRQGSLDFWRAAGRALGIDWRKLTD
jgi:transcriptional regulator with XRE-family HTH domain